MRRVTVLSRRAVEDMDRAPERTVFVSITDPTAPGYPGDGNENRAKVPSNAHAVLRLRFWDCDPDSLERQFAEWVKTAEEWNVADTRRYIDQQITQAMTADHAGEIVTFLARYPECDVIVHCEAGISRSAGVAAALVASDPAWTWQNEARGGYRPNAHVKSLVVSAHREVRKARTARIKSKEPS